MGLQIIGLGGPNQFNNFPALVDRLKQGQINTLVLARMLKRGDFNVDPAFQVSPGVGGMPGPDDEMFYFGASLGGIIRHLLRGAARRTSSASTSTCPA